MPVIIGGSGALRTPRLAAQRFERVRETCRGIGRDPATMTFSVTQTVCCGSTDAAVRRRIG